MLPSFVKSTFSVIFYSKQQVILCNFPANACFLHCGNLIFEVLKMLGIGDISYNQPKSLPYPTERPF